MEKGKKECLEDDTKGQIGVNLIDERRFMTFWRQKTIWGANAWEALRASLTSTVWKYTLKWYTCATGGVLSRIEPFKSSGDRIRTDKCIKFTYIYYIKLLLIWYPCQFFSRCHRVWKNVRHHIFAPGRPMKYPVNEKCHEIYELDLAADMCLRPWWCFFQNLSSFLLSSGEACGLPYYSYCILKTLKFQCFLPFFRKIVCRNVDFCIWYVKIYLKILKRNCRWNDDVLKRKQWGCFWFFEKKRIGFMAVRSWKFSFCPQHLRVWFSGTCP